MPHLSISGTGDGTFDYFIFTVPAGGGRGIFDLDNVTGFSNGLGDLFLFDEFGVELFQSDDSSATDGQDANAFIDYEFKSGGRYVVGVSDQFGFTEGGFIGGDTVLAGATYTLHVSVAGHDTLAGTDPLLEVEPNDTDFLSRKAIGGDLGVYGVAVGADEAQQQGILVRKLTGSATFDESSGQDILFAGNSETGVLIELGGTTATFNNGTYMNNGRNGITVEEFDEVSISNVTVSGTIDTGPGKSAGGGIKIEEIDGDVTLTNVTSTGNGREGVKIEGVDNVTISGVDLSDNDSHGLTIDDVGGVTIDDSTGPNTFQDNKADGLRIDSANAVTVIDATITGNGDGGLRTAEIDDLSVSESTVQIRVLEPSPDDYHTLFTGGPVTLGSDTMTYPTLELEFDFTPTVGDTFTLIDNQGGQPISGQFKGLPEGATFLVDGLPYTITYQGGTGNDVVVEAVAPVTITAVIDDDTDQRSMVRWVTITFDEPQASAAAALATVAITRDGGLTGTLILSGKLDASLTELKVTFSGTAITGKSLPDGRYTLKVDGETILDADDDFFRFFGDLNGNAIIDEDEVSAFALAMNTRRGVTYTGGKAYNEYLDFNSDGYVNSRDATQFDIRAVMMTLP